MFSSSFKSGWATLPGQRPYRALCVIFAIILILVLVFQVSFRRPPVHIGHVQDPVTEEDDKISPKPKYLPEPQWIPPPIQDPFPGLAVDDPPPVPAWNVPVEGLYRQYDLEYAPPLFIGFTRTWPILLQAVISYITAGWPPSQIYVVENTGVPRANAEAKLSLQNPFYLNHAQLKKLGVKIVEAPVLMSFAQLQNFFIHLAHQNSWPFYFWSHMDVLALSYENGKDDITPKAGERGYKTMYELCLQELDRFRRSDERWAAQHFAYDYLTLVRREAYDDVGGWDTFIPYYITDCDMNARLTMRNWTLRDGDAGIIADINTVLKDLRALYRDPLAELGFIDPNPAAPSLEEAQIEQRQVEEIHEAAEDDADYWSQLRKVVASMDAYKQGKRGRNTWQVGQHGGQGEPYFYHHRGIAEGIDVMTEAGREVFRRKWGHRDCDLIDGAGLRFDDQWRVDRDW